MNTPTPGTPTPPKLTVTPAALAPVNPPLVRNPPTILKLVTSTQPPLPIPPATPPTVILPVLQKNVYVPPPPDTTDKDLGALLTEAFFERNAPTPPAEPAPQLVKTVTRPPGAAPMGVVPVGVGGRRDIPEYDYEAYGWGPGWDF